MKKGDDFICAACGGAYTCAWDDEEAWKEAAGNGFGDIPKLEMEIICNPCYRAMGFKSSPTLKGKGNERISKNLT